ncbi:MAG: IclR family transcriptional regulator [Marmoricola sp.]
MTETQDTAAAKIVGLLEVLSDSDTAARDGLTVVELSRVLGREKSVVSRRLKPLVELGIVERGVDGRHRVGWRLFAVAARAGDQRLLLLAPPVMRRLTQLTQESVHLSVRRGAEVFTILTESPNRTVEAVGWIGRTSPVSSTSSGRVLLMDHTDEELTELLRDRFERGSGPNAPRDVPDLIARVDLARRDGYALVLDEFGDDLAAAAAPVREASGRIIAALNVRAPSYRLEDDLVAVARKVKGAALHLSRALTKPVPAH